ncbi:uncharacterized protein LOC131669131 [Phymastichus coffea]|uniref:uncharacterized protein LOC131669131 n=1 Tax=Phymastichus coffea TaxID=108790 RepID=UPI00273CEF6F|nr:uncharacterized protein LOC131669131 [Phymastichus coffea]
MPWKLVILLTCSSFLRAFAEDYFVVPPNHRLSDHGLFNFYYYVPTIANEQPKRFRTGRRPALRMMPPNPNAVSNYADYYGLPVAEMDDGVPYNHRPYPATVNQNPKDMRDERPTYTREHDPFTAHSVQSETGKSQEFKMNRKKKLNKRPAEALELSSDGDRVEFQIQGHEGPATYVFGYDTGDGENRQYRLEERLPDGSVKGHYGYYDARGKLRTVRYLAQPDIGYTEKHHESNKVSSEEEEQEKNQN